MNVRVERIVCAKEKRNIEFNGLLFITGGTKCAPRAIIDLSNEWEWLIEFDYFDDDTTADRVSTTSISVQKLE